MLSSFLFAHGSAASENKAAVCEFHNHGDLKKDKTGPCQYSSDKEEIKIKLSNGEVLRFVEERKRKGHYIDQDGNRLDVKKNNDYTLTYRWKNQRLVVMLAER
ncbi:hypothetical protein NOR53_622 [gamma proteobacterium NOR5-3]|nr:hypothetical protein NOR53_622 [gamma proteobacterium NOR5-3]